MHCKSPDFKHKENFSVTFKVPNKIISYPEVFNLIMGNSQLATISPTKSLGIEIDSNITFKHTKVTSAKTLLYYLFNGKYQAVSRCAYNDLFILHFLLSSNNNLWHRVLRPFRPIRSKPKYAFT